MMRRAIIIQWVAILLILSGVFGLAISYKMIVLVPIGFLIAIVNSIVTSLKMAKAADKIIDKLD